MTPILSVAIPTHNRERYAKAAIRSLLALPDPDIEIVVSDTSHDQSLREALEAEGLLTDGRLIYQKPTVQLDMTGNHNAALARCRGRYVCLIGDDDTVTPELPQAARWAASRDLDVLVPNVVASYVWPDFRSRYFGSAHAGRLYFSKDLNANVQVIDAGVALESALRDATQGTDGLPKLYHGLASRDLLEQIRQSTGNYVHGSSPDMSLAIALTQVCRKFLTVNYPLTVPGASGGSNTGRSAMNQHKGRMGADSQTRAFLTQGWSKGVPRFYSVETVWAHAALDTLQIMAPERVTDFNYARLIAACRLRHPEYCDAIAVAESQCVELLGCSLSDWTQLRERAERVLRRERLTALMRRMSNPTVSGGRPYVANLDDVSKVAVPIAKHVNKLGLSWHLAQARLDAQVI